MPRLLFLFFVSRFPCSFCFARAVVQGLDPRPTCPRRFYNSVSPPVYPSRLLHKKKLGPRSLLLSNLPPKVGLCFLGPFTYSHSTLLLPVLSLLRYQLTTLLSLLPGTGKPPFARALLSADTLHRYQHLVGLDQDSLEPHNSCIIILQIDIAAHCF
ncbi:hypothetical protein J3F84DRAFT_389562 [Trichoderma pleuroticola]